MITNMNKYLNNGPQTEITPLIKKIARTFKSKNLYLVIEVLNWLKKINFKYVDSPEEKMKIFRKRTASEIIESRIVSGCTDFALVFISLMRAEGIPTKYIEGIRRRWLEVGKEEESIEGHIFAECFIKNKWYIVDPKEGTIRIGYNRFVVFKEGLDSWDIGIKDFDELKNQFWGFKKKYKNRV